MHDELGTIRAEDIAESPERFIEKLRTEGSGVGEPPDGDYNVAIQNVNVTRANADNGDVIRYRLRIIDGPFKSRTLFRNHFIPDHGADPENFERQARWLWHDLVETLGVDFGRDVYNINNLKGRLINRCLSITKTTTRKRLSGVLRVFTNISFNHVVQASLEGLENKPAGQAGGNEVPF